MYDGRRGVVLAQVLNMNKEIRSMYIEFLQYGFRLVQIEGYRTALQVSLGRITHVDFGNNRYPQDQLWIKYGVFKQL